LANGFSCPEGVALFQFFRSKQKERKKIENCKMVKEEIHRIFISAELLQHIFLSKKKCLKNNVVVTTTRVLQKQIYVHTFKILEQDLLSF